MHRLQELIRLHRLGRGSRAVARELRMSPNTERRYRTIFKDSGILAGDPSKLPELAELRAAIAEDGKNKIVPVSSINRWRPQIEDLHKKGASPKAIFDWLRRERKDDFQGSYSAVKRMCKRLTKERGPTQESVVIPIDAAPGEAQVDFGYLGRFFDPSTGRLRKVWVFVLVMAQSRRMVCRIAFDQRIETWIQLHVEAFEELGAVPTTIVPDNLKAAVIRAAFGVNKEPSLNRSYRELARYYGFRIDPTPPRSPQKKGRVESAVRYVKSSFLTTFGPSAGPSDHKHDAPSLAASLALWVAQTANTRHHGTTGKRPIEAFEEEKVALVPLPARRFDPILWRKAKVHRDSHVAFQKRLYSVPWRLIGKTVWIKADSHSVLIYAEDCRIAAHARRGSGSRSTLPGHLPEERAALGQRSREYWENRAAAIAPCVRDFICRVFEQDRVLSMLRQVQAIVTHLESFPKQRAIAACRRADFYKVYRYSAIKRILCLALDREPLPATPSAGSTTASSTPVRYRFARDIREMMHHSTTKEKTDECHKHPLSYPQEAASERPS